MPNWCSTSYRIVGNAEEVNDLFAKIKRLDEMDKPLVENGFGIGLLTKEFISNKLNDSLFEIKTNITIPTRFLVYATKSNSIPSFTTTRFIELLRDTK